MEAHILWLQKTQTVSDQSFDSCAVFAKDARSFISMSRRADKQSQDEPTRPTKIQQEDNTVQPLSEILAIIGTLISLCGFITQFVGLRGMHWSATIAQLGATLAMTIMRAWVRRGLAKRPYTQPLDQEYELDWLATKLGTSGDIPWPESTPKRRTTESKDFSQGGSTPKSEHFWSQKCEKQFPDQKSMEIRAHLGEVAGWHGPAFDKAISVAKAVEAALISLSPLLPEVLDWSFETPQGQMINFSNTRLENGKWKVDATKIEATLSLCLFASHKGEDAQQQPSIKGLPTQEEQGRRRLLGPYTESLHRDLRWWMVGNGVRIVVASHKATENGAKTIRETSQGVTGPEVDGEVDETQISGVAESIAVLGPQEPLQARRELPELFDGSPANEQNNSTRLTRAEANISESENVWGVVSDTSLSSQYAQDMFSDFIAAVASKLTGPISGKVDVRPASSTTAWQSFTLYSSTLFQIAQDVQSTGLGSLEEAYLSIIPSLSMARKLPKTDGIVELARQQAEGHELLGQWQEAGEVYLWLFRTCITFGAKDDIAIKATVVLMEFLRSLDLAIEKRVGQLYEKAAINQLNTLRSGIIEEFNKADKNFLSGVVKIFEKQGRIWNSGSTGNIGETLGVGTGSRDEEATIDGQLGHNRLHELAGDSAMDQYDLKREMVNIIEDGADVNAKEILCWTPLHYALAKGQDGTVEVLLKAGADVNAKDLVGWTPLHYACRRDDSSIIWKLLQYVAEVGVQGRDRVSPLHCAAIEGHLEVARSLVEAGADVNVLDASRNTPLHCAAYNGRLEVTELLCQEANKRLREHNGRTPLHLAAIGGHEAVAKLLLEKGAELESKDSGGHWDSGGHTPLHLAAQGGHEVVAKLLLEKGAELESNDSGGHTPLHLAAKGGHEVVAKLLLEKGAELV
jgi:ankyrin repeat protein